MLFCELFSPKKKRSLKTKYSFALFGFLQLEERVFPHISASLPICLFTSVLPCLYVSLPLYLSTSLPFYLCSHHLLSLIAAQR